jgi:hypothetical protein
LRVTSTFVVLPSSVAIELRLTSRPFFQVSVASTWYEKRLKSTSLTWTLARAVTCVVPSSFCTMVIRD